MEVGGDRQREAEMEEEEGGDRRRGGGEGGRKDASRDVRRAKEKQTRFQFRMKSFI